MLNSSNDNSNQNPQLRFRDFSEKWEEKILDSVTTYTDYRGKSPTKAKEGIFLVTAKNIKKGFIDYEISKEFILKEDYTEVMRRGLPEIGDVLFTTEAPLGNVAQVDNTNIALAQRVIKFRAKVGFSNTFIKYYLLTDKFQRDLISKASGGTVLGIKGKVLHKMFLNLPKEEEQIKIANFFSSIDDWIDNLTKHQLALEKYKIGMMQKFYSQQIRFKDENDKNFPDWEEKLLGDIATFSKGDGIPKSEVIENGRNKCIRYGELYTTYKEKIVNVLSRTNVSTEGARLSEKNDILMPTSDVTPKGLAKACALDESGIILGGDILVIRSKEIYNLFFSYYISSNKKDVMRLVNGVTVYHLYGSDLAKMKVKIPTISEQKRIAEFLETIDYLISQKNEQIDLIKLWKKGLMQKMFI